MDSRILLADSNQTIQKVVKMTLDGEPFILDICDKPKNILNVINEKNYDLVLLNFTFDDDCNGYDLTKKLLDINQKLKVLLIFGTFDSIDESQIRLCGAVDKMIKPFDSTRLIDICNKYISGEGASSKESFIENEPYDEMENDAQGWSIQSSENELEGALEDDDFSQVQAKNEIAGWGFEVPGIIGERSYEDTRPPAITEIDESDFSSTEATDPQINIDDFNLSEKFSPSNENNSENLLAQKMTPLADLVPEEELPSVDDELQSSNDYEIESQIMDEVDSVNEWVLDSNNDESEEIQISAADSAPPEITKDLPGDLTDPHIGASSLDLGRNFESELREKITPIVEKLVKKYCQETLEKVAWEIIPDLAENLIKEELSKISDQVINDQL